MLELHNPSMLKQIALKGKKNIVLDNVNYSFRRHCSEPPKRRGLQRKQGQASFRRREEKKMEKELKQYTSSENLDNTHF